MHCAELATDLHRFSRKVAVRGRDSLNDKNNDAQPSKYAVLCSKRFLEYGYERRTKMPIWSKNALGPQY